MVRKSKLSIQRNIIHLILLFPAFFLYVTIVLIPFFQGIPISFTDWNGVSQVKNFIGLQNYIMLFSNNEFWNAIWNTFYYTFFLIVFSNILGLSLALLVHKGTRFNNFARTIFFMPFVLSLVTVAFIWSFIFTDVYTPITGLPSPLGLSSQVMMGIVVMSTWVCTGYCMIIFIAALQSVPLEYYETANIEGANKLQELRHVTMPSIMPAFAANITILLAWGIKVFDYPMAATNGGPGQASETIAMYIFNNIFGYLKAGYGQAASVIMVAMLAILSISISKMLRSMVVEV